MKRIIISGAADGIGKALARQFIAEGHQVIGIDVDAQRAEQTRAELGERLSFVIADLTQSERLPAIAEQIGGGLDAVIHNAGISEVGYFQQSDIDRQAQVIALNLTAPLVLTREWLARGALNEWASLVFMSSLSHYISYPGASVYSATKSGLASYARSLAITDPRLHVMTVYPGPTRTAHARRYSPDNSRENRRMSADALAEQIVSAMERRQRVLIPGTSNKLFALIGRWFPAITNYAMRKTLLEKF
ncbi:MAG: SDR family NAD(P)-dependent oxidoreductase [Anaerolineae bacterium]